MHRANARGRTLNASFTSPQYEPVVSVWNIGRFDDEGLVDEAADVEEDASVFDIASEVQESQVMMITE